MSADYAKRLLNVPSCCFALFLVCASFAAAAQPVTVREEAVTFPAWKLGPPEAMPVWKVRGGTIYPYPMFDKLTEEKTTATYRGVRLENEYVSALVLPEIGGRLHDAFDKTAGGYHFLQDQRTIKPALVGMAGAWISGGIEWNFPHGHRPSGFRPVEHRIVENPDGSKTVWTGEIERTCGMRWAVGNTVHPGRTWIETRVRLTNCTPYPKPFLWWADAGVRGSQQFQAVIPGEIATGHSKHEFYRWPVNEGVDLRRWENAPGGTSYFIVGSQDDFHGSWSPEEQGGLVHWADHHIVRGKKLWYCGTSPAGRLWESVLTDGDAPLVEPQAGAYSDNQPDYHWLLPGETKTFSHFWFPVRGIGGWDWANLEGAVSLRLEKGRINAGWYPTGAVPGAAVILKSGTAELVRRSLDAAPGTPVNLSAAPLKGVELYDYRICVLDADGDTLIAFSLPRPANPPLPSPEPPFPAPDKAESNEKLLLMGDYHERFGEPERAEACYREALRRDSGDLRSNTALGVMLLKRGLYADAAEYLKKALSRDETYGKTRYYLGLAFLGLGEHRRAESELARASYDFTYYGVSNLYLACLSARQGRWVEALERATRAVRGNGDNTEARAVQALALNRLGRFAEALEAAADAQVDDPLDFLSASERAKALEGLGRTMQAKAARDTLYALLRGESFNRIELAVRYARCGLYGEAARVIESTGELKTPMLLYHLAWCRHMQGENAASREALDRARRADPALNFPSGLESLPVLEWAAAAAPDDPPALSLLGELFFSLGRRDEAIAAWEKSTGLDRSNARAWRNLGYSRAERGDNAGARAAYEAAVAAGSSLAVSMTELDQVLERLDVSRQERLELLERHRATVLSTDPSIKRLVSLYVQLGRHRDALETLAARRFHCWEGGYDVHRYWVEANLALGDQAFSRGEYTAALDYYRAAMSYPDNLEVKAQPGVKYTRENYKAGAALEALGRKKEARELYFAVVSDSLPGSSAAQYFRGRALERLGRRAESRAVFERMLSAVENTGFSDDGGPGDGLPLSEKVPLARERFRRALALEGLGRKAEADQLRSSALALDPIVELRSFGPPRAGW